MSGGVRARVTQRLVGMEGGSLSARARARRFGMLLDRFPELAQMRVLDLGGEPHTWRAAPVRPREVVLLNLGWQTGRQEAELGDDGAWMSVVAGDACAPPASLRRERFDLVFSNSVIEHVGGHARRRAFAAAVHDLAPAHWVQTPNRYFPLEPHWVCPGFQFLPPRAQARVMRHWPVGNYSARAWTREEALRLVLGTELVSETQMRFYFPASDILHERFAGLTKSLIAVAG